VITICRLMWTEDEPSFTGRYFHIDGAAAPQGRALDLGLKLAYQLNAHLGFSVGLRTLEGGVDNKKNTNLVRFDYVTLGIRSRF
jgi:hypothetical protein